MKLGMKMRFNESFELKGFTPEMIELYLADQDLHEHWKEIIDTFSMLPRIPFIIHAPIYLWVKMENPPLVDISSLHEKQREMSVDILRKTFDLFGEMDSDYVIAHPGGQTPNRIIERNGFKGKSIGEGGLRKWGVERERLTNRLIDRDGFTNGAMENDVYVKRSMRGNRFTSSSMDKNGFMSKQTKSDRVMNSSREGGGSTNRSMGDSWHTRDLIKTENLYSRLMNSLDVLERDYSLQDLLMENMPWHFWMWEGKERWYSNLLHLPEDFDPLLDRVNIVLDICHAYLLNEKGSNENIFGFLRELKGYIKHIHLSDAAPPDKEGLQFGEGEIELQKVFKQILHMDVTAIPEIRGGHLNDREGLRLAIDRFNKILLGSSSE